MNIIKIQSLNLEFGRKGILKIDSVEFKSAYATVEKEKQSNQGNMGQN